MGLDTYLQMMVGVAVNDLLIGEPAKKTTSKTKYCQDTGKPYEVEVVNWCVGTVLGDNIVLEKEGKSRIAEYFEKMGFEVYGESDNIFHGVVGVKVGKEESRDGSQTMNVAAPKPGEVLDLIVSLQKKFLEAGFSQEIADMVKLYAVVDASY